MAIFFDLILLLSLIVIGFFDERERRIPNKLLLFILGIYFIGMIFYGSFFSLENLKRLIYSGLTLLTGLLFCMKRPNSIGMGDIKLISIIILNMGLVEGAITIWLSLLITLIRALLNKLFAGNKGTTDKHYPLAMQVALAFSIQFFYLYGELFLKGFK